MSLMGQFQLQNSLAFSATRYMIFQECKRRFFYQYLLKYSTSLDAVSERIKTHWQLNKKLEEPYHFWLWEVMKISKAILCTKHMFTVDEIETYLRKHFQRIHIIPQKATETYFSTLKKEGWFDYLFKIYSQKENYLNRPAIDVLEYCGHTFIAGMPILSYENGIIHAMRLSGRPHDHAWISDTIALKLAGFHTHLPIQEMRLHKLHLNQEVFSWQHHRITNDMLLTHENNLVQLANDFCFQEGQRFEIKSFPQSIDKECLFCPYKKYICENS